MAGMSCSLDAEAGFVGGQTESTLGANTQPADEYTLPCENSAERRGTVDRRYVLVMSNGTEFGVSGMRRADVLRKLKRTAVMLNTPNGVMIVPKLEK